MPTDCTEALVVAGADMTGVAALALTAGVACTDTAGIAGAATTGAGLVGTETAGETAMVAGEAALAGAFNPLATPLL